jgi:hypothetical protein
MFNGYLLSLLVCFLLFFQTKMVAQTDKEMIFLLKVSSLTAENPTKLLSDFQSLNPDVVVEQTSSDEWRFTLSSQEQLETFNAPSIKKICTLYELSIIKLDYVPLRFDSTEKSSDSAETSPTKKKIVKNIGEK